jgi:stage V sporulation protein G
VEITDIRIKKVSTGGKLKAYVTVTFDDCFVVHNLKIISGKAGTFIAMPSRKTKTGEYKDIAHPINSEFRHLIQSEIIDQYEKVQDEPEMVGAEDVLVSEEFESDEAQG